MAKKLYEEEDIREIACAIREKCGDETAKYKCCDMGDAIRALSASGSGEAVIEPLTITTNGTYTASTGVDGYSPITVNVPNERNKMIEAAIICNSLVGEYSNDEVYGKIRGSFFSYNSGLTAIDLPNATNVGDNAFKRCSQLTTVNISSAEEIGLEAFYYCYSLASINMERAEMIKDFAFQACSKLTEVYLPGNCYIGKGAFYGRGQISTDSAVMDLNGTLKLVDTGAYYIQRHAFSYQSHLTTVVLRNQYRVSGDFYTDGTGVFTETPFDGTPIESGEGYIYVPRALIAEYEEASWWRLYNYRALEDYTVDGTIYGAIDKTKI